MPLRESNVSTIAIEKFNGLIKTVRRNVNNVGNNLILDPAPGTGRRIISITLSVGATATEVELFHGNARSYNNVIAGAYFAVNSRLQDDHGVAGNGYLIPAGDPVYAWLGAANATKVIIKYTDDVKGS